MVPAPIFKHVETLKAGHHLRSEELMQSRWVLTQGILTLHFLTLVELFKFL